MCGLAECFRCCCSIFSAQSVLPFSPDSSVIKDQSVSQTSITSLHFSGHPDLHKHLLHLLLANYLVHYRLSLQVRFREPVLSVVLMLLLLLVKSNKFHLQGCFIDLFWRRKTVKVWHQHPETYKLLAQDQMLLRVC